MKAIFKRFQILLAAGILFVASAQGQKITINSVDVLNGCIGGTVSLTFTTQNGNGTHEKFFDIQDAKKSNGFAATTFYTVFSDGVNTVQSEAFNLSHVDFPAPSNATKVVSYLVPVPTSLTVGTTYSMTLKSVNPNVEAAMGSVNVLVTENNLSGSMSIINTTVCQGSPSPQITFTANGASGGSYTFYYELNDVPSQVTTAIGQNTMTISVPTGAVASYTYLFTGFTHSNSSCGMIFGSGESVIDVVAPPAGNITASNGTSLSCATPSTILTAPLGTGYTWSTGATTRSITVTTGGNWSVTVNNGCAAVFSITTTLNNTPPSAVVTNNSNTTELTCNTTSINLTAGGGVSYQWSHSLGNNASVSIINPGTYSVTVTGSNGCRSDATIVITKAALPTATISAPISVCSNMPQANLSFAVTGSGAKTVTYSDGLTQYNVSGNGSNLSVTVAPATTTTYAVVSVVDASGCVNTATTSATVKVVACSANAMVDRIDPTCAGEANGSIHIQLSGGTAPFSISFDNGSSWELVNGNRVDKRGLSAGVYNIYLKHGDGMIQPLSTTTLVNPTAVTAEIKTTGEISCTNSLVTISVNNIRFGSGAPYMTSINGGEYTNATNFQVAPGMQSISVQDRNGCRYPVGIVMVAGLDPIAFETFQVTHATNGLGNNGIVHVKTKGGSGTYMITITRSNGSNTIVNAGTSTLTFTGLSVGSYIMDISDKNGCGSITRNFVIEGPQQAPTAADLVLGSESNSNNFSGSEGSVTIVYNIVNTSPTGAASGVKLRVTKPNKDYSMSLLSSATFTSRLGVVYELDNSRWTLTANNDSYVEFSLNNDPAGQNLIPAAMSVPKRVAVLVSRMTQATGKGEFNITGMIYASAPDANEFDNTSSHRYTAQ